MHNKLFIADGVMAVAGGRNIADEYFMLNASQNFVDMDAFLMGAVVGQLSAIFDAYWNSPVVLPIAELAAAEAAYVGEATPQQRFARLVDGPSMPVAVLPDVDALGYGPLSEDLEAGKVGLIWDAARAYADPPDKLARMTAKEAVEQSVSFDAMMTLWKAQRELVITSPYLIPGRMGVESITSLRKAGVKVTILTNSLAATDEPLVHVGYARYRLAMLGAGVDLYELSPSRTRSAKRLGLLGSSTGRLHAKTAVVDRRTVFVGSMNLDPRSESQNTELGIFIDSPELAAEMLRVISISRLQGAYRLRLDAARGIEWLSSDDDKETVLSAEPESSWRLRLHNFVFGWLVPEQLL
jgi:putative cardiolipin synthase